LKNWLSCIFLDYKDSKKTYRRQLNMTITIEPYTINSNIENSNIPITYWGIYLDDNKISTTSTKEQAEKTKEWMENWLDTRN
jgi:hypothetical protein